MWWSRSWLPVLAVAVAWLSESEALMPGGPEMHTSKGQKLDHSISRSYSDRMEDAAWSVIIGFFIFTLTFPFVVLVEWDSVAFLAMLSRMRNVCYPISNEQVQEKHDNFGTVHISGRLRSDEPQTDTEVGYFPKRKCVALYRCVEQMKNVEYRSSSKDAYHFEYRLEWREVGRPDLRIFGEVKPGRAVRGNQNKVMCGNKSLGSAMLVDSPVWVGAFQIGASILPHISEWTDCDLYEDGDHVFEAAGRCFNPAIEGLHLGTRPEAWSQKRPDAHERFWSHFSGISDTAPKEIVAEIHPRGAPPTFALYGSGTTAGDVRISYKALYEDELVSFCGVQNGNTLRRFHMSFDGVTETRDQRQDKIANRYEQLTDRAGDDHTDKVSFSWPSMVKWMRGWTGSVFPQKLLLVTKSARSKDNLYDAEYWDCVRKVWQMRVWGFFGFTLGFYLMLSPIWEVVSFLPWIDFLLAHFFWVVSIIVGFILIVTVASIAWILFHPEFLGLLLAGAGLAFHYNALVGPECTIPGGAMHTDGGRTFQSCSRDMQVGWILIAAAALPLLIFVYRFYDSWRYVTLVEEGLREADKESKV